MKQSLPREEARPGGTIGALDGVRAIACLMVITYHISLMAHDRNLWSMNSDTLVTALLMAGNAGVTLFFVLSGFLLFLPYARALLFDQSWPSARLFYMRRALRIIPGYYFSLLLIVLLAHPEYLQPARWNQLLLFPFFLMDSTTATFQQLNGPYWTLAIEWQFYLLLPLIALGVFAVTRLAARWMRAHERPAGARMAELDRASDQRERECGNRVPASGPGRRPGEAKRPPPQAHPDRRVWVVGGCLLALVGWGVFTRYWGAYFMAHPTATFLVPRGVLNGVLFFTYGTDGKFLEDFAIGMLAGLGFTFLHHPARATSARRLRQVSRWLWCCGVLLLLGMVMQYAPAFHDLFHPYSWLSELGLSVGFGCCILAILFDGATLQRFFEWAPLRGIGLMSYSLYIWHLPLLNAFQRYMTPSFSGLPHLLAYSFYWVWVALVVFPFSFAVYRLVEQPGMRLSNRLRGKWAAQRKPKPLPRARELDQAAGEMVASLRSDGASAICL